MEFSVHRPSPPNTYSYVREENSGSTRKSQMVDTRNLKIVVPPAHAQRVFLSWAKSKGITIGRGLSTTGV
jgi:hypothetical protein